MTRFNISRALLLLLNGVFAQTTLPAQSSLPTQITLAPALQSSLLSEACQVIIDGCPFAQPYCVSKYCMPTTNNALGSCDTQNTCCGGSNVQACLVSANLQDACNNVANSFILCPTTSGALATCLCSAGNFDNEVSKCAGLVSGGSHSEVATYLSGSTGLLGFCSKVAGQTPATSKMSSSGISASGSSMVGSVSTKGRTASMTSAGSTPAGTASAPSATKTSGASATPLFNEWRSMISCIWLSVVFWILVM